MNGRTKRLPIELAEIITGGKSAYDIDADIPPKTRLCLELVRDVFQNGLTKKQKCYIMLYYKERLTMEQIAKRCNVNRSTVSRTIAGARRKIEKRVERYL